MPVSIVFTAAARADGIELSAFDELLLQKEERSLHFALHVHPQLPVVAMMQRDSVWSTRSIR